MEPGASFKNYEFSLRHDFIDLGWCYRETARQTPNRDHVFSTFSPGHVKADRLSSSRADGNRLILILGSADIQYCVIGSLSAAGIDHYHRYRGCLTRRNARRFDSEV